jgi:ABC-type lipopolysaccharide export system ATPase subunit
VFADLPGIYEVLRSRLVRVNTISGLTDTNAHRVRAARLYLRKCDFIFIAHTNTRAGDDPTFKNNIKACHRLKRNGNIAVVITQSDVRTAVLYMRLYVGSTL